MTWPSRRRDRLARMPTASMSCKGKRSYGSWQEADVIALRTRRDTDEKLAPYRCRFCQCWHVGHHLVVRRPIKQRPE